MKIAVYSRKSVYIENSESIETQIKIIKNYFAGSAADFEIFEDEGFSGKDTKRPAFNRMMELCKLNKFDVVACYKIDRISRNIIDFVSIYDILKKHNTKLISVTEGFDMSSPIGKMIMIILGTFADMERENISQRVKDNMLAMAKKGLWCGGVAPRGYTIVKNDDNKSILEINNIQYIKDMFNYYLACGSLWEANKRLSEKYNNNFANERSLLQALRNPTYCKSNKEVNEYFKYKGWEIVGTPNGKGYIRYGVSSKNPCLIVSKHKAVIEPKTFLEVNTRLDKNNVEYHKKKSRNCILNGVLYCPYCKKPYHVFNNNKKTYYVCSSHLNRNKKGSSCINKKYVLADEIEHKIERELIPLMLDDNTLKNMYTQNNDITADISKLTKEMNNYISKANNLSNKLIYANEETSKIIIDKMNELTSKSAALKNEIEVLKLKDLKNKNSRLDINSIKNNINLLLSNIDNLTKRNIYNSTFKHLFYDPMNDHLQVEF